MNTPDDTVILLQRDLLDAGQRIYQRKRRIARVKAFFAVLYFIALAAWVVRVEMALR